MGSARIARLEHGAKYGQPKGRQGMSYAIITKDLTKDRHPSIHPELIVRQIAELYNYARINQDLDFFVVYSSTGSHLSGWTSDDLALFFQRAGDIPDNIVFEQDFLRLVLKHIKLHSS
jgi:hypothetical protein